MGRRQKHGFVTNGRTTTFYGDHANHFMARQAVLHCDDQKRAYELQRPVLKLVKEKKEVGAYGKALIHELRRSHFKIYKDIERKGL